MQPQPKSLESTSRWGSCFCAAALLSCCFVSCMMISTSLLIPGIILLCRLRCCMLFAAPASR